MAFSTQKNFFHVPFMNETVEYECKKACVKLKSYDSTIDDRSWAMDDATQSKFLSDLVTCQTPVSGFDGLESLRGDAATLSGLGDGVVGADSLLQCTNTNLAKLDEMLNKNKDLKRQLEISNERLKTATDENKKIKDIMNAKYDSSHSKDFYNKIQKLASSGKLNKSEEKELMDIYNSIEEMNRAYEVLQAENSYVKRLLEKLTRRANYDSIKLEPEKSTDVKFLQDEVNSLRKEVSMLRKMEDDKMKNQQGSGKKSVSEQDAENLKLIIKERNALREKCKTFKELEKKVHELQKKSKEADHMSDSLSSNLDSQCKYIDNIENEMKCMHDYFDDQLSKSKLSEELLKCQIAELKEDLMRAKCEVQKVECLELENGCLRNELKRRDFAINDYDCQYKQLMFVIEELQGNTIQNLQDTQTQTCNDYVDDLAFYASATLSEIMKELNKRGEGPSGDGKFGWPGQQVYRERPVTNDVTAVRIMNMSPDECCQELERLERTVQQLNVEKAKIPKDCEELCAEALKKLQELESQHAKLKKEAEQCKSDNERLSTAMQGQANKLDGFSSKLGKIDKDMVRNINDTSEIGKDLRQSIQLVKDISDIQLKNKQLAQTVNAQSTQDAQKALDDLRRQLAAEQDKNKQCQSENQDLKTEMLKRGIDPEKIIKAGAAVKDGKPGTEVGKDGRPDSAAQKDGKPATESGKDDKPGGAKGDKAGVDDKPGPAKEDKAGAKDDKPGAAKDDKAGAKDDKPGAEKVITAGAAVKDGKPGTEVGKDGRPDSAAQKDGKPDTESGKEDKPGGAKGDKAGVDDKPGPAKEDKAGAKDDKPGAAKDDKAGAKDGKPGAAKDDKAGAKDDKPGAAKDDKAGAKDDKPGAVKDDKAGAKDDKPGAVKDDKVGGKDDKPGAAKVGAKVDKPGAKDDKPGAAKDAKAGAKDDKPGAAKGGKVEAKDDKPKTKDDKPGAAKDDKPGVKDDKPGAAKDDKPGADLGDKSPDKVKIGEDGKPVDAAGKPETRQAGDETARPGDVPPKSGNAGADDKPGAAKDDIAAVKDDKPGAKDDIPVAGKDDSAGAKGADLGDKSPAEVAKVGPAEKGKVKIGEDGKPVDAAGKPETRKAGDETARPGGLPPKSGSAGAGGAGPADKGDFASAAPVGRDRAPGGTGPGGKGTAPEGESGTGASVSRRRPPSFKAGTSAERQAAMAKDDKDGGADAYNEFITKNAASMSSKLKQGCGLERELRTILDTFIQECGFCFCKNNIPRSKFYSLVHKLLHYGLRTMSFHELGYVHKKIYVTAEKMRPGCLFDMIISEHENDDRLKCCSCKNTLCCSSSEEILREKVCKLERDFEQAKEYFEILKACPQQTSSHRSHTSQACCSREHSPTHECNRTFRQPSSKTQRVTTKQLQNFKV